MDIKGLQEILQDKLPNAMKTFADLERSISPLLSQVNAHRDKMTDEQLKAYDSAMRDIDNAKKQMRQNADSSNR